MSNELSKELNKDLPYGSTPYEDNISGLKLKIKPGQVLSRKDVYLAEAENIKKAIMKYLTAIQTKDEASFDLSWMLELHYVLLELGRCIPVLVHKKSCYLSSILILLLYTHQTKLPLN